MTSDKKFEKDLGYWFSKKITQLLILLITAMLGIIGFFLHDFYNEVKANHQQVITKIEAVEKSVSGLSGDLEGLQGFLKGKGIISANNYNIESDER